MHQFGNDPFGDPYSASSQDDSNGSAGQTNNDYDPFGDTGGREITIANSTTPKNAPPVEPPAYEEPAPSIDNEAILRRQAELDKRAEEIRRMERTMAQNAQMGGGNHPNNFPPFPECCPDPLRPCFYQDISAEIPGASQTTVRMLFYFWISYCVLNLFNFLFCMIIFFSGNDGVGGTTFGLSIAWMLATSCCSFVCWFRPVYKAFRSDSSINYFIFFFIMFGQCCWSIFAAIGIPGTGFLGWLTAFSVTENVGLQIVGYTTAVLLTIFAVLASILLKKVHSMYRGTNASFAQAQSEFSSQVMQRGAAAGMNNVASYA